jgi:hypothetical protein
LRIRAFDQLQLPFASPGLELLFARDREADVVKALDIDEPVNSVFLGEPRAVTFPVLKAAACNIVRDAEIERPIPFAGENLYDL